jgi:diaminopimelate decarboxylase
VLRARAEALRAALPPAVEVAYAAKANGSPVVLSTLAGTGLGLSLIHI